MTLSRYESRLNEGTTGHYYARIYVEILRRDFKIPTRVELAKINTLTLTYKHADTATVINSRSAQNVKNANNVSIHDDGEIHWELQTADTVVTDSTLDAGEYDHNIAQFTWTTTDGDTGIHEVDIYIKNGAF
jgi:hypothetical protein